MSTVIGKIDISDFSGDGLEIIGNDGFDRLFGTQSSELIDGRGGNDIIFGNDGSDLIIGGAGNDTIRAGAGDDSIVGSEGNDIILGEIGDDVIEAGSGNDTIFGDFGDDYIHGAEGDDVINGGGGNDTIDGGSGFDTMLGGAGADVFEFNIEDFAAGEADIVGDFRIGEDTIVIKGASEDDITIDPTTNSISINGGIITIGGAKVSSLEIEENEDGDYEII